MTRASADEQKIASDSHAFFREASGSSNPLRNTRSNKPTRTPNWKELARTDALTGIKNRLALQFDFSIDCGRARRRQEKLVLVEGDGDGLRLLNNSLGHDVGDELIKKVAGRLNRLHPNRAYRLGGDEYVVLFRTASTVATRAHLRRLRQEFAQPMTIGGHHRVFGISFGFAVGTPDTSLAQLLKRADRAMYRQKALRRGDHESGRISNPEKTWHEALAAKPRSNDNPRTLNEDGTAVFFVSGGQTFKEVATINDQTMAALRE